jgi:hypothetical protein
LELCLWAWSIMKKVILVFPSISSIADFVIKQCIKGAQVIASENKLLANLSEKQMEIASNDYNAIIRLPLIY